MNINDINITKGFFEESAPISKEQWDGIVINKNEMDNRQWPIILGLCSFLFFIGGLLIGYYIGIYYG